MAKKVRNNVAIIGCGPGSMKHMTLGALRRIQEADVVVGSRRLLNLFPEVKAEKFVLGKNYRVLLTKIERLSARKNVVILVSGDPGFFSYARLVISRLGKEHCDVIPGISSVQLAFASVGLHWCDAYFTSLHGRKSELENLVDIIKTHDKVAVLTDVSMSPKVVCTALKKGGVKGKKIYLCENLSMKNEKVKEYDISSFSKVNSENMNVMIFLSEGYN
ncbi:MAG: precorrin-6y C5,15-methyltransferase (decarboxylating) subunit CbiE [Planctomycetes bacterium]|nr:precorrin-6y C5,15-methyltransferase (decarboxylating) subunit CbiE [Planctomycetota bacterium]